jgi:isoleucyl-tRNA synthetase
MTEPSKKKDKNAYRATLQLPKTSFDMRANLLKKEPKIQERWGRINLQSRISEKAHPAGSFVFHDGPPYANGSIHLGHLLNKILKDLVVRNRVMAGYDVRFVPGWDCHGLPIEHKVSKELGAEARSLGRQEIRRRCHDYAARFQKLQAEQMIRLGTMGDYEHPYLTMDPAYEGATLEVFASLVEEGLVYRDLKPVHWSIENETALADAELEYYDREDTSVFVFFDLMNPENVPSGLGSPGNVPIALMIWTTTPWTLPANLAVAVAPGAEYGLYRVTFQGEERLVIMAEALASQVLGPVVDGQSELLGRCLGRDLVEAGLAYHHPFIDRTSPVVAADYVTLEDGTGMVHTAPGHGTEDYQTGLKEGLKIYCPVLQDGTFDRTVPEWLHGKSVWEANGLVVDQLKATGHLFRSESFTHSYPHDWRGKTPVIFRATEQWFISVDRPFGERSMSLRQLAIEEADQKIEFVPEWGRNRLRGMLESRPDWCISRQRSWGLPIPAFHGENNGEVLLTAASVRAVARFTREHGSDAWFSSDPGTILAGYDPESDPEAPQWCKELGRENLSNLTKGADIFDVWFESGSSWNGVLRERGIGYPADLYLEGSDQHRGWFQLSQLAALGATGQSPFRTLLTHGFMVTGQGEKMSKSLGNTIEVDDLLTKYGADICRWWTASLNYNNDIKVDWDYFQVASDEYRKVRNTLRFLLGNLGDFEESEHRYSFTDLDKTSVDGWALSELNKLIAVVLEGYRSYQFKKVREAIFNFCNDTVSAVYLPAVKDRLYCDRVDEPRRRRTQTVLFEIASALIRLVSPILVHTADEAWQAFIGADDDWEGSVHLEEFPTPSDWECDKAWPSILALRDRVMKELEEAKKRGLANPLDAGIKASVPGGELTTMFKFLPDLADLCGVSRFSLEADMSFYVEVQDLSEAPRCERSWKRDETVRERRDGGMLSDRDALAIGV